CFVQAEDGIRDWSVTGVETCALPISAGVGLSVARLHLLAAIHRIGQPQQHCLATPAPDLEPAMLLDELAHQGSKGVVGAILDLGALAVPPRLVVGNNVDALSTVAVNARSQLARGDQRQWLADLRIVLQLAPRQV